MLYDIIQTPDQQGREKYETPASNLFFPTKIMREFSFAMNTLKRQRQSSRCLKIQARDHKNQLASKVHSQYDRDAQQVKLNSTNILLIQPQKQREDQGKKAKKQI